MVSKKFLKKQKPPLEVGNEAVSYRDLANKSNLLLHLMHELAKAPTKERMCHLTAKYSLRIFGVESCSIYFKSETSKKLVNFCTFSVDKLKKEISDLKILQEYSLSTAQPIVRAFKTRKIVSVNHEIALQNRDLSLKSAFFIPILLKDQTLGVFALRSGRSNFLSVQDLKVGELLALHLGVKIHNQELADSARFQKETLELLQNSVKEGLSLHGPDGVIYYANKAISHFFGNTRSTIGVKREELISNWGKYHKYEATRLYDPEEMRRTVYVEKRPFLNNLMVIHSTPPKIIEANYYPVVKNNTFAGMAAAYRDVTKEKKQEEELEQNFKRTQKEKERWQAVFSNVDEGVCLVDRNLKITHMNTTCEQASGLELSSAIGQSYHKIFKCHTSSGLYFPDFNPLEKVLITKETIPYEEHLHKNPLGEDYWVGTSIAPILDNNGEIQEIVIVIRDISSLKEIEKAKSQFVSIASHELRTPLTVINGYLSLLMNGDLGDFSDVDSRKRLDNALGKLYGETTRLTSLVSDLLNVSRIEEKRIQLDKKPTLIKEVINEVLDELGFVAAQKKINLRAESLPGQEKITATIDQSKISQVLINLVDNAVKFTNQGGEVIINYWQEGESVYIAVKDNGIGIPRKLQTIIFEKFQQVPGSYLKENRGTGLGLYIVKSLVELHNGQIGVSSEPGRGTKFIFSLPV